MQAFNSADLYLLESALLEQPVEQALIVNDNFGALACFCKAKSITWVSDSYVATMATKKNLQLNGLGNKKIMFQDLSQPINTPPTLVLMRLPKSLAMLEYQLAMLSQIITHKTKIIASGMTKEIHKSTIRIFERYLGPCPTSLAQKKARLILPTGEYLAAKELPPPVCWALPDNEMKICNLANLFSREQLDIGARFFIHHIPKGKFKNIIDLGCGNGVIGLVAALKNPDAKLSFIDESQMAVQSAKNNYQYNFPSRQANASFIQDNCMEGAALRTELNSSDLILCNPPFHQQNSISDHIAWQMFNDAKKVLQIGGILRIIGNRHLGYHLKLKQIFGNCTQVAANNKFVVLQSVKERK